jgi:hypothetical protein
MFNYRPMEPGDAKFVLNAWKQSWRVSPWAGVVRNDEYYDSIHATIEGLALRGMTIEVATSESGRIVAFCASEVLKDGSCCIHYLYAKDPYLATNVGRKLIERAPGTRPGFYTFRYRQVAEACPREDGWRHAPEIARRK